jgi:hypothetical protein
MIQFLPTIAEKLEELLNLVVESEPSVADVLPRKQEEIAKPVKTHSSPVKTATEQKMNSSSPKKRRYLVFCCFYYKLFYTFPFYCYSQYTNSKFWEDNFPIYGENGWHRLNQVRFFIFSFSRYLNILEKRVQKSKRDLEKEIS